MKDHLLTIGIMTGNSLDAADVVLTAFHKDGTIKDLSFHSLKSPIELADKLRDLRTFINARNGDMVYVANHYQHVATGQNFDTVLNEYMSFVAQAVQNLLAEARIKPDIPAHYNVSEIDVIGFHGQTCAHSPPSAKNNSVYTVQIGDGQKLSDLIGIPVIYDFRSDDVMNGGEGAPFAPRHNEHISEPLKATGDFPITFINAGNTSNLAHISTKADGTMVTLGWDAGPFNHLPDGLMRKYANKQSDENGALGKTGKINMALLEQLFHEAAIKADGTNFLQALPPKSSDPQWYRWPSLLDDSSIPLQDRVRTAEYFSAYLTYHALGHTPADITLPSTFALFGGGWKNPVIWQDFSDLVEGNKASLPTLPEHQEWFERIEQRLKKTGKAPKIQWANDFGFDGQAMEARIFADMARCYIINKPFTTPEMTKVKQPTSCGLLCYPHKNPTKASQNLQQWLAQRAPSPLSVSGRDSRWSRASRGWDRNP